MKTAYSLIIAVMLLTLGQAHAAAGNAAAGPSVEARIERTQVYDGDSLVYEVHVKNAKEGVTPDVSALKADFDVSERGHQVLHNSMTIIINGLDMSKDADSTTVYRYFLTPKRQGTLTVPAPFIVVDGVKITGNAMAIQVISAAKQDLVGVEIKPAKDQVMPNEPFEVALKIWVKPLPGDERDPLTLLDPPRLNFNWLDAPDGLKVREPLGEWLAHVDNTRMQRGFMIMYKEQWALLNLYKGREKRKADDGQEYNYFVYELKRTFIAGRAGSIAFGPATVKGDFVNGIAPGGRRFTVTPVFSVASAKTVKVATLAAAPANFNGCYGPFKLHSAASATDLRVGDPVTLTLEFEALPGAGMLEDVTPPDLTINSKITENFTVVDKAPMGRLIGSSKNFAYVLRPKKAGVSIPSITVSTYNMGTEKFEELSTQPIALNVTESPQLRNEQVVSNGPVNNNHTIGGNEKGVFQNVADPAEINKTALNPVSYISAVVGMWVVYAAMLAALTIVRRRAGDDVLQRRIRAQVEAATSLTTARAALKDGKGSETGLAVHRAITGLIGIWNGSPPEGMTARDVALVLEKTAASKESRIEAVRVLSAIEEAKYGSMEGLQAAKLVEDAEKLIPVLQREMAGRN